MNDAVIIQFANIDGEATYCNHICAAMYANKDYAIKHKIDYIVSFKTINSNKIPRERMKMMLEALRTYEYVFWLDADAVIVGNQDDFRNIWGEKEYFLGFVKYDIPCEHLNTGIFCIRRSAQTIETLEEWISRPFYDAWKEQRTLNNMYAEDEFKPWIREIDPKWNDLTYHRYSEEPIVLACHGSNTPDFKYMMMVKDVLTSYGWPKKGA